MPGYHGQSLTRGKVKGCRLPAGPDLTPCGTASRPVVIW
jgi:hypothetical protein